MGIVWYPPVTLFARYIHGPWYSYYRQRLLLREKRKKEAFTNPHQSTYYWWTQTIQAVWIHASRHIVIDTDNEERDKKILNVKGSLGHWHVCYNPAGLLTFRWKTDCWINMPKVHLLKQRPIVSIFSEVSASRRLVNWGCHNRTMFAARPWTFTLWKLSNLSSCGVQSVPGFWRHARCMFEFPDVNM